MFIYVAIALASAVALIWRHPLADLAARASSPIGAGFAFLDRLCARHGVGLRPEYYAAPGKSGIKTDAILMRRRLPDADPASENGNATGD
jgi:hypothetical protein